MRAKDIQTSTMEKQDILQFEIHLAAATNKVCMYVYLMKICLFYDTKWKNNRTVSCMKSGEKHNKICKGNCCLVTGFVPEIRCSG